MGNPLRNPSFGYIHRLEARLEPDQREMLQRIYEPTVVGVPLSDARRDLCVLPDGELRSYGYPYSTRAHAHDGPCVYLSSRDGGLSWTRHYARGTMNACTWFGKAGVYLAPEELPDGLYIKRSTMGPDDPAPERIKVADGRFGDSFQPTASVFSDRIWFTSQRSDNADPENPHRFPCFFYSDDFGKTWTLRELPETPPFRVTPPHRGTRWCKGSGTEPHAAELPDGRMMMIIRSPHDCFYQSFSRDGGHSWSAPEPSTFYGTNTTAFLLRLSDGRLLVFWNNTKPLPEEDLSAVIPPLDGGTQAGIAEDTFTNRDAAHAAISADGQRFTGYREILLNPIRGNTDFRYIGGVKETNDKSSHQFQAIELPYGKILVTVGQNIAARRMVIFDVNWLYETAAREDFTEHALTRLTTHTYLKSVSGHTVHLTGNGHCAWNRAPAAFPMPDPEGGCGEVLSIAKLRDPRLYNAIGGAVWNFPASGRGRVTVNLKLAEKTARLTLSDRWYNTCDPYAASDAPFSFELDVSQIGTGYVTVALDYDTQAGKAWVRVDGVPLTEIPMAHPTPTGISYLLLQCDAQGDSQGYFVRSLEKHDTAP